MRRSYQCQIANKFLFKFGPQSTREKVRQVKQMHFVNNTYKEPTMQISMKYILVATPITAKNIRLSQLRVIL